MAISDPPHWKEPFWNRGPKYNKIVAMIALLNTHKTNHQDAGTDELSVAGLSGLLADGQTPLAHKTSHQPGGGDAMAVDAAAATGSLRTIGSGALQAAAGNHSHDGTYFVTIAPGAFTMFTDNVTPHDDRSAPYARPDSTDAVWSMNAFGGDWFNSGISPTPAMRGFWVDISGHIPRPSGKTVTITNVRIRIRNGGGGSGERLSMVYQDWDAGATNPTEHQFDTSITTLYETVTFGNDLTLADDRMVWIACRPATGWTVIKGIEVEYTIA